MSRFGEHLESATSSPMGSEDHDHNQDHDHDLDHHDHNHDEHQSHDEDVKTSSEGNSNSRGVSLDSNGNMKKGGKKNGGGSSGVSGIGGTSGGGGAGGHNSNQMRRDQNRIAQREFRMRKQQHIKDLEARVEILSSDGEERQELMALLVRSLLAENAQLRKMVKTMAAFVGEGLATSLPRIGVTLEEMHEFLTRPETESVHAAYQALKEARAKELSGELKLGSGTAGGALDLSLMFKGVGESSGGKRKRGSLGGGISSISAGVAEPDKRSRARSSVGGGAEEEAGGGGAGGGGGGRRPSGPSPISASPLNGARETTFTAPLVNATASSSGGGVMAPATGYLPMNDYEVAFNNANGIPTANTTDNSIRYNAQPYPSQSVPQFVGQFATGIQPLPIGSMGSQTSLDVRIPNGISEQPVSDLPPNPTWPNGTDAPVQPPGQMLDDSDASWDDILKMQTSLLEDGGKKWEAFQLITYHMENFRQNPNYHLPPSLAPTRIQRTIAHEHLIDGVVQPSLRDQMILMRGKYNILKVFRDLSTQYEIPGEDPLDHRNWEISEEWMIKYFILVNRELIATCNRWRAQRGDRLLDYDELRREAIKQGTAGPSK